MRLTIKSTILRPLTKCFNYNACVINSQQIMTFAFMVDVATVVYLLYHQYIAF